MNAVGQGCSPTVGLTNKPVPYADSNPFFTTYSSYSDSFFKAYSSYSDSFFKAYSCADRLT